MAQEISLAFLLQNSSNSKRPVIVVQIDGVEDIFASAIVGTKIVYGDPIFYGELDPSGKPYVYGGLRPWTSPGGGTVKQYLQIDKSSMTLDLRLEPEQGKCSVSQFMLSFIDKDGYFTNLCTPGKVIPEIMGVGCSVYLGYEELSFPDQYIRVSRGVIQGVQFVGSRCTLQLADCGIKRRQQIFFTAATELASDINSSTTTIPVVSNSEFYQQILGPDGLADNDVKTYIGIGDEWIEYDRLAFQNNSFNQGSGGVVTRGARGTTAASHTTGDPVKAAIELTGNPIFLMLKIMLSGWNGYCIEDQPLASIAYTGDPLIGNPTNSLTLPPNTDAIGTLGLSQGDYLTIVDATNPSNNKTVRVVSFATVNGRPNRLINTDDTFVMESTTTAKINIRSQYDTLPVIAGLRMVTNQVDVASHNAALTFFASELVSWFQTDAEYSGKDFIERQLNLPLSLYSTAVGGTVGVRATLPPIAGQQLITLDSSNVLFPDQIAVDRNLSQSRKFFNQIDFQFNENDQGSFDSIIKSFDAVSFQTIGIVTVLPIESRVTKSTLTSEQILNQRCLRFLNRYKNGCVVISCSINFGAAITLNIGDVVILRDDGGLKLPNFTTGERDAGTALYEIIGLTIDFKNGRANVQLLSGLNFSIQDNFATIAPSSHISPGGANTTSSFLIEPSYDAIFSVEEWRKWVDYVGCEISVHNSTFSQESTSTLIAVSQTGVLTVDPPLAFVPDASHVIDFAKYAAVGSTTAKIVHVFLDRTVPIVSGISNTQFTVDVGDLPYLAVDLPIYLIKDDLSYFGDIDDTLTITDITGTTITVSQDLGFTPDNTYSVELAQFADGGTPYRLI